MLIYRGKNLLYHFDGACHIPSWAERRVNEQINITNACCDQSSITEGLDKFEQYLFLHGCGHNDDGTKDIGFIREFSLLIMPSVFHNFIIKISKQPVSRSGFKRGQRND